MPGLKLASVLSLPFLSAERGLNKIQRLRFMAARVMLISVAVLGGLSSGAYFMDQWATARDNAMQELTGKVNALSNESSALKTKIKKAEDSLPIYMMLAKRYPGGEMQLDRENAGQVMNMLQEDLLLPSLRVSFSPISDMDPHYYRNKFLEGEECNVSLSAEALSDEHIMALLQELRRLLPGKLQVTHFTLERSAPLTQQTFTDIAKSGKVTLMRSEIHMRWMGTKATSAKTEKKR